MDYDINLDSRYLRSGEWARLDGETIIFGISKYAYLCTACEFIMFHVKVGSQLHARASMATVEIGTGVGDVFAPVSGIVVAINKSIEGNPKIVSEDPYGKGWFIKIQPTDNNEFEHLMDFRSYAQWLDQVEESKEKWKLNKIHSPEDMIGTITLSGHKVVAIKAMGAESVVFDLLNLDTGELDTVLKVPRGQFKLRRF